jgi:hypothetical protein
MRSRREVLIDQVMSKPGGHEMTGTRTIPSSPKPRQLPVGCYPRPKGAGFHAVACINGKQLYQGDFKTPEEASEAVQCAKREAGK